MVAGVAEKFFWLSKTFSGSFRLVVYPSRVHIKLKGNEKTSFYRITWFKRLVVLKTDKGCNDFRWYPSQFQQTLVLIFAGKSMHVKIHTKMVQFLVGFWHKKSEIR